MFGYFVSIYLFIYFYLTLTFFLCFHILLSLLLQTGDVPEIYHISSRMNKQNFHLIMTPAESINKVMNPDQSY